MDLLMDEGVRDVCIDIGAAVSGAGGERAQDAQAIPLHVPEGHSGCVAGPSDQGEHLQQGAGWLW